MTVSDEPWMVTMSRAEDGRVVHLHLSGRPAVLLPVLEAHKLGSALHAASGLDTDPDENALVRYARQELERAGSFDEDAPWAASILAAVKGFTAYGHSGSSAAVAISVLERLLRFKPLSPLTSDPDEWMKVSDELWQSCRDPAVFSHDGGATWAEAT
jgi:hypothetical protein